MSRQPRTGRSAAFLQGTGTLGPMARLRKSPAWRRLAIALGVLLLISGVTWFLVVPVVVEDQVRGALERAGWEDTAFEIEGYGLEELTLRDVELERTGALSIERVEVRYTVSDLFAGRVQSLVLHGLTWRPADEESAESSTPSEDAFAEARSERALPELPLRRVKVEGGRLLLEEAGVPVAFEWGGELEIEDEGWSGSVQLRDAERVAEIEFALTDRGAEASGNVSLAIGAMEDPLALEGSLSVAFEKGQRRLETNLGGTAEGRGSFAGIFFVASGGRLTVRSRGSLGGQVEGTLALRLGEEGSLTFPTSEDGSVQLHGGRVELGVSGSKEEKLRWKFVCRGVRARGASTWDARGIEGDVEGEGLPLRTTTPQELSCSRLLLGPVQGEKGRVRFSLPADGTPFLVEEASWHLDEEGLLSTEPFEIGQTLRLKLLAHEVPLEPWLDLVSRGKVEGHGRLRGRVQLDLSLPPRFDLRLVDGELRAVGSGRIAMAEDPEVMGWMRRNVALPASRKVEGRGSVDIQGRIMNSLRDFAYETFELALVPLDEMLRLRIRLAGRGSSHERQELDLQVNLNGINALLDAALGIRSALDARRSSGTRSQKGE